MIIARFYFFVNKFFHKKQLFYEKVPTLLLFLQHYVDIQSNKCFLNLFYFLAEGSVADVKAAGKRKQKCE